MTGATTFAGGLITIQNLDGGLFFLFACAVVGLGFWAAFKHEATEEPSLALKRCQSCGAQIDLIDGEWEHVDDNALLVLRAGRHIPEPLTGVHG